MERMLEKKITESNYRHFTDEEINDPITAENKTVITRDFVVMESCLLPGIAQGMRLGYGRGVQFVSVIRNVGARLTTASYLCLAVVVGGKRL